MLKSSTVTELKEKLDNKQELLIVDCREQFEWDLEHIEGAKLIPLSVFQDEYIQLKDWKDKEVFMQCRSGARSEKMGEFLISKGFSNVANLEGGIMDWKKNNFPIIKKDS
jgi:rhodanese-related sulfurtransferase